MSALRKLSLSPKNRAVALAKLPAPIAAEIRQAEQAKAERARKAAKEAKRRKFEELMRSCFPAAFRVPRAPLMIGIFDRVLEAAPDIDRYDLSRFLAHWTSRDDYRDAIAHLEPRLNLNGLPAGTPTPEQQAHAARQLWGPRAEAMLAKIRARAGDGA